MFRNCAFAAVAAFILALAPMGIAVQDLQPPPDKAEKFGRGYKPLSPEKRALYHAQSAHKHGGRLAMLAKFKENNPAAFDTRDKGWVLPVGNQGSCGSCYLYSTVMTMTQAFVKSGYGKNDGSFVLAVQFGMDCHNFGGCGGGNGTEVVDWACNNGWPAEKWVETNGTTHNDYPAYSASSQRCRQVTGAKTWKPASWGFVSASANRPATTLEIQTALINFGPLNVSLDAGGQFGNGTGTITNLGRNIDHEIELVAYDDAKDGGAFLLKNQWDTSWGNGGYRWCTYKACQSLVDVFFVTAAQLPPPPDPIPPVPPVPPGPGPGPIPPSPDGDTIIQIVSPRVIGGKMTLEGSAVGTNDLIRQLFKLNGINPIPVPPSPKTMEQRLDDLEASRLEDRRILLEAIKKLEK